MGIETKQIQYAKELDDVGVLLLGLVDTIKQGKSIAGLVDELVVAIEGISEVGEEFSNHRRVALSTLMGRLGEMADALLAPKVAAEEAAPNV